MVAFFQEYKSSKFKGINKPFGANEIKMTQKPRSEWICGKWDLKLQVYNVFIKAHFYNEVSKGQLKSHCSESSLFEGESKLPVLDEEKLCNLL
jgi:hypothetical protein